MSWFQLDPESIVQRANADAKPTVPPCLFASIGRGVVGFTIVSLAGFAPWALFGRWFHRTVGEIGMYAACAVVFIGLSGLLLHRLIIGPGALERFYKLFGAAFTAYSVAWIAGWMALRGHPGSIVGLLAGTAIMGWMFSRAFEARSALIKVISSLFVLNSLGYFVGGWVEGVVMAPKELNLYGLLIAKKTQMRTAMLLWGVCYGIGFGAGLGLAFHLCQSRVRELLPTKTENTPHVS